MTNVFTLVASLVGAIVLLGLAVALWCFIDRLHTRRKTQRRQRAQGSD